MIKILKYHKQWLEREERMNPTSYQIYYWNVTLEAEEIEETQLNDRETSLILRLDKTYLKSEQALSLICVDDRGDYDKLHILGISLYFFTINQ